MLVKWSEVWLEYYCQDSCWAQTLIQIRVACWAGYKMGRHTGAAMLLWPLCAGQ